MYFYGKKWTLSNKILCEKGDKHQIYLKFNSLFKTNFIF